MEGVEDQLERLNKELIYILGEIKDNQRNNPSRLSIVPSEQFNESFSDKSDCESYRERIESKVEELLQDLDQKEMIIEDFRSEFMRKEVKLDYPRTKILELISKLDQVVNGESSTIPIGPLKLNFLNEEGKITLRFINKGGSSAYPEYLDEEEHKKTDASSLLGSSIESEDVCAICGIDAVKLRRKIRLEIETEVKQRKSEVIEKEKANFERQLEELDKLKESYIKKCKENTVLAKKLDSRKNELEKQELVFAKKKSEFEKKKQEWERKIVDPKRKNKNSFDEVFSPSKYSQEELEKMLLETRSEINTSEDSKALMKINQIENQLSKYRTEKAISESNKQNARLIYSLVQTFDKESTQDQNKRKQMIEKTYRTYNRLTEAKEKPKVEDPAEIKKTNEEIAMQLFQKKYELLAQKERELTIKEKNLENSIKKINIMN